MLCLFTDRQNRHIEVHRTRAITTSNGIGYRTDEKKPTNKFEHANLSNRRGSQYKKMRSNPRSVLHNYEFKYTNTFSYGKDDGDFQRRLKFILMASHHLELAPLEGILHNLPFGRFI